MIGYEGDIAVIPLGTTGLYTDGPQTSIPPTSLIRSQNCNFYNNVLQKDFGSRIWNKTPLQSGVVRAAEMYPDSQSQMQRIFTLLKDGTLWKFTNYFTSTQIAPDPLLQTNPVTIPVTVNSKNYTSMTVGGNELTGNPKKLFVMTGNDIVQVVSGDANVRHNISKPPGDWTGTYQPFGSVIHRGILFAWGNINGSHNLYGSSALDHEDFQSTPLNFTVYPGEYDGITCCAVFRGQLYIFKYPLGVYFLVDSDPSSSKWYVQKLSDDFGAVSPQSAAIVNNDLLVANNFGTLSSLQASLIFGDVSASDVFHALGCFRYATDLVRPDIVYQRGMIYYGKKRQIMMSFQSNNNSFMDSIALIDYKNQSSPPKATFLDKDQPNCLFMVRDQYKVPKPFYGANDGNLYEMDVPDRWVGNASGGTQTAYTFEAQTPHMDFSQGNALIGSQVKCFDFLELQYESTGDWDVSVDIYIDSRFSETVKFNLSGRSDLDEFPLGDSAVDAYSPFYFKKEIHGEGKTISLRFYNSGLGQDVRLVQAKIYYRLSGQQTTVG